ncbi:MAG: DUF3014 domain-containing protein [Burkholderiaceae bacterium]|nr:DUF3014 domain-containing protein [Burkholderiaceae bacterium]
MSRRTIALWAAAAVLALLAAAVWWWSQPESPAPLPAIAPAPVPVAVPEPPASAPVADAAPSAPAADAAPIADGDEAVTAALIERFGRAVVLQLMQTDGFAARVVATVDNLPRGHVAPRLWPINPTAGRFSVDDDDRIAAANGQRYAAALRLLDALPPAEAAAFYRRLYPQLQAAYGALGYPGQSFHDRLRAVIDHLLETPAVSRPPQVQLVEVKGDVPSQRPWVRYEYVDPALQQLSAGQRLLLRLGPAQQARVLDWLRALRPLL